MKRKLKFTITKIRRQTTAKVAFHSHASCPECNPEADVLTPAESIALLESKDPMLANRVADGEIHAVQSDAPSICANSITQKGEI